MSIINTNPTRTNSGRGPKTTYQQCIAMVAAAEDEKCYKLITGSATSTLKGVVAGAKVRKVDGYEMVKDLVNQLCSTNWSTRQTEVKFKSYHRCYKKTLKGYKDVTGPKFVVTAADIKKGIKTIPMKLEKLCPGFARMDVLFGSRQNLSPTSLSEGSDDEDEDENENDQDDEDDNDEENEEYEFEVLQADEVAADV